MHIVDGRKIAREIEQEIRESIETGKPFVATILVEGSKESELYAKLKEKACKRVGFNSKTLRFSRNACKEEIIDAVKRLNEDEGIHGIMIQMPLPGIEHNEVVKVIDPKKDVEGVHPYNMGMTLLNKEFLVPCTPRAVLKILEHENVDVKSKDVVIINHSNIVGKPLAAMMLNRNATVSVCHVYTKNFKEYTGRADIVVTGAGVKGLITGEHVRDGSIVIDVGIVKEGGKVYGDVDLDSVKEKAEIITPVPGGVGPVTIACMLENVVKTYCNRKS
ncbi:MAG: bifunctional 5,10-methylenetetrahydrofolate dehydrogenase/5,10-methenyltetrahydrofolate cyclohydrolase [Candidatus Thermoplasmatota archaeon]|nr:bifunctional 5,10-methylenetetrahydrofolate dehydrogenase/5,10-methenyltetrahydrofolate cyclohydrolase [Candidatus Thermoplasmatota archaeon]